MIKLQNLNSYDKQLAARKFLQASGEDTTMEVKNINGRDFQSSEWKVCITDADRRGGKHRSQSELLSTEQQRNSF